MKRGKNKDWKLAMIALLIVSSVAITIGYASFSQILTINGEATVEKSTWKIGFENLSSAILVGTAEEVTHPSISSGGTDIYKSTVDRIINEYDRAIVTSKSIESINEDEYNVIEVTNIEELLDAHDSTGQPILYNETIENNVSVFVIVADDILYKLTIDRHELEENERECIRKKNEYIQQKIDNINIFKKEK